MKNIILSVLFLILFSGCSIINVYSDYDQEVQFSKYKKFAFYKKGFDSLNISDLDKRRIMDAISKELKSKGLLFSKCCADLYINVKITKQNKINIYRSNTWFYGYYHHWWYSPDYIDSYQEGSIFVDFVDVEKKQLVWQGKASNRIPENISNKRNYINAIIHQVLNQYPPDEGGQHKPY